MSATGRFIDRIWPPAWLYSTYEAQVVKRLDRSAVPRHVAVLADDNRRWARLNAPGQPLVAGCRAGAAKLQQFVEWCDDIGIPVITLWVLSTDNLDRSAANELEPLLEVVNGLMVALADTGRWRVQAVGGLDLLPKERAASLRASAARTEAVEGMHINVAVSYGGRHELRDAFRSLLAERTAQGRTLEKMATTVEIDEISKHLYTKGQPDPDLIIRTSEKQRLSGFLLWRSAHSEFYFCEALWPDFRKVNFVRALRNYTQRERRFGR